MEFKSEKVSDEKNTKSKEKVLLKKIKSLEEDKAKATIAKNKLERDLIKSTLINLFPNLEKQTQTEDNSNNQNNSFPLEP